MKVTFHLNKKGQIRVRLTADQDYIDSYSLKYLAIALLENDIHYEARKKKGTDEIKVLTIFAIPRPQIKSPI